MSPGRLLSFSHSVSQSPPKSPSVSLSTAPYHDAEARGTRLPHLSAMAHAKKHSIAGLLDSKVRDRSKDKSKDKAKARNISVDRHDLKHIARSPQLHPTRPVNKLDIIWESPPNIFYGTPQQSSGALFSGQLRVTVADAELTLDTFTMDLVAAITSRKPVQHGCPECATQNTTLFTWTIIKAPKTLKAGQHDFPFSYLLPGHLPATTHGSLGVLEYTLQAEATSKGSGSDKPSIKLRYPLPVSRAINPLPDKNSLRIFPPTNLTAQLTFAPVIHPIGEFGAYLRISGVAEVQKDIQVRWRLRKMTWRLEETEKMISPACARHGAKVGGQGKGIQYEDVRTLGFEDRKEGWKTNFNDNLVEMEFSYRSSGSTRPLCDAESPTGLHITHALVIELVVAEEWATLKRPDMATPTGSARVLRMQFPVIITERSGMGISWDEEQPPMYEDVPASPPLYATGHAARIGRALMANEDSSNRNSSAMGRAETFDYTGPPLDEPSPIDEMERLNLGEPRAEPSSAYPRRGRFDMADLEIEERRGRGWREEDDEQERAPEEPDVGTVN